jgi:oligosaccharide repeat unit polymerase
MFEITSYLDLPSALVIDLTTLLLCVVVLLRYGRLAHSHPAIIYLLFHLLVVPTRLIAVMNGAPTLFGGYEYFFEAVREGELVRAALLADLALAIMTVAWIRASTVENKNRSPHPQRIGTEAVTLSQRHIWLVVAFSFPIGIVGFLLIGNLPGFEKQIDLGEWQESSWISITMTWAGLALLALIYWYGFRWWLTIPVAVYLSLMAIQGYHRFRVVIPVLLMLQIYLDRRGKKWPPVIAVVGIVAGILIFFPLKTIGRMTQAGASLNEISQSSSELIKDAMVGQAADQEVLDQLASSLTLIDQAGKFYYGATYLVLLTSPIPKQVWPDKPGLADYQKDFSTPSRPMGEMGMIMTFIGEFYINFGYLGIVVMSYLTAYWLARGYFRAYRSDYSSVARFVYLLIACNLIQVYRDGLMSIVVYTMVNMMPLTIIVLLHLVWPVRRAERLVPGHHRASY